MTMAVQNVTSGNIALGQISVKKQMWTIASDSFGVYDPVLQPAVNLAFQILTGSRCPPSRYGTRRRNTLERSEREDVTGTCLRVPFSTTASDFPLPIGSATQTSPIAITQ
jgi:hypothetical protein